MVVGVGTGLETLHRNAPASIRAGHVWVDPKRGACRPGGSRPGCQRGAGANYEDFVGARPVKRELGLEDLGVRVRLRALADASRQQRILGIACSASERAELRSSTRENLRAWCSRTISYARAGCRSPSRSRQGGRGPSSGDRRPRCVRNL